MINLIKNSIQSTRLDSEVTTKIRTIFELFTKIFKVIIELRKMEEVHWQKEMFDEEYYLIDLKREIFGVIDIIIVKLDAELQRISIAELDIKNINRPLEALRINQLKEDILDARSKIDSMRIQF